MTLSSNQNSVLPSRISYLMDTFKQKQKESLLVVFAGIVSTFFEGIGITLLIPTFSFLMNPLAQTQPPNGFMAYFQNIYAFFGFDLTIGTTLVGFVMLVVFSNLFLLCQNMFIVHFNYHYEYQLSQDLYKSLFSAQWQKLSQLMRGELMNTFAKEINFARSVYQSFLLCLVSAVKVGVLIFFSFFISVKLTVLVLSVGLFMAIVVQFLSKIARQLGDNGKRCRSVLMETLINVLDNVKFIKLMSLGDKNCELLDTVTQDLREASIKVGYQGHIVTFVNTSLMAALVSVVLFVGTSYFNLELSHILVLLLICGRLSPAMIQLFGSYNWINSMLISLETVEKTKKELLSHQEISISAHKVDFSKSITFNQVAFSYDTTPVLSGIDFTIHKGEYVAIVGETGSGKTTILDLLLFLLYPTSGNIQIDGFSTRDIDMNYWRDQVAYVGPENYLIAKSIKENMLIANKRNYLTDQDIICALRNATLGKYIQDLPNGIFTDLLDRGQNLSTGQKQRLNLARAFLRDASILIFDEPTSALDFETEKLIRERISQYRGEKTIIVVTHKKELAQDADRVIEVANGLVSEVKYHLV